MQDYYEKTLKSHEYGAGRAQKARVVDAVIGSELRSAARIGDVGSGSGLLKRELETITGRIVFGFEIEADTPVERRRTCIADGTCLPVRGGTFDLLILNHIYEHVADPIALFEETARVLRPGGRAYVSAGNKWMIMEPHYRLPFLSWMPARIADFYVRWMRRGASYRGIRFLGYRSVVQCMSVSGLHIEDITEKAIRRGLGQSGKKSWRRAWRMLMVLPTPVRAWVLRRSPQWFFLLERREVRA